MNYIPNDSIIEDERVKILSKSIESNTAFVELLLVPKDYYECPSCRSTSIIKNGHTYKYPKIEIVPHYNNCVRLSVQRFKCLKCGKTFYDNSKITFRYDQISISTKYQILLDLKEDISFTCIAKKNGVSIDSVIDVFNKYVYPKKYPLSETICIDEFKNLKSAKGKYAFLIFDPINRKIIEVLESRLIKDLRKYFYNLGYEERIKVKYVVSDMNDQYRYIVSKYFPQATYVVDGFHYLRYIEDAFNDVRIRVMNRHPTSDNKYKILKKYWRILSNYYIDLGELELNNYIRGEKTTVDNIINDALDIDPELYDAYSLTQGFLKAFRELKYENAEEYINKWIEELYYSDIEEFHNLYKMFENWKQEIINSFIRFGDKRLSNGPIEGMNNHIKEIKRIAFGYRNFNHFRKRILYMINEEPKITK